MRALVYARISQKDEDFDKVEDQIAKCTALCEKEKYQFDGIEDIDVFSDDDISAWSGKLRPGFQGLLNAMRTGDYDVVVVRDQNRLARNGQEWNAFAALAVKEEVQLHSVATGGLFDLTDPIIMAIAGVLAIFGELDSALKSKNIKARIKTIQDEGNPWAGARPYGYEKDRMTLRESEAEWVRNAYTWLLEGVTLYNIAARFREGGQVTSTGKVWTGNSLRELLLRPRNATYVERYKVLQEGLRGNWERLIDDDVYDAAVSLLRHPDKNVKRGSDVSWIGAGIVLCGVCNEVMRSAGANIRGVKTPVYRCSRKTDQKGSDGVRHTTARRSDLDPLIRREIIKAFFYGPNLLVPEGDGSVARRTAIEIELAQIREQRENIKEATKLPGFSAADFTAEAKTLVAREEALNTEKAEIAADSAHAAMVLNTALDWYDSDTHKVDWKKTTQAHEALGERFDSLSIDHQRALLKSLLKVTVHPGKGTHRFELEHLVVKQLNHVE